MEQLKIVCDVPKDVAARAGSSRYGTVTFAVEDAHLAELSADERAALCRFTSYSPLAIPQCKGSPLDWETVRDALRATLATDEERRSREKRENEERRERAVTKALAKPLGDWIGRGSRDFVLHNGQYAETGVREWEPELKDFPGWEGDDAVKSDPRIKARRAELEPAFRELHSAWEKRYAAWEAAVAEARAEVQARTERYARLCREYVIGHVDEYKRAACLGKKVNAVAERHATKALNERLLVVQQRRLPDVDRLPLHGSEEEQPAPHQTAYEVYDEVSQALRHFECPLIAGWSASIIRRRNRSRTRTCVQVEIRWVDDEVSHLWVYADAAPPPDRFFDEPADVDDDE
jgi:hypothetical protein